MIVDLHASNIDVAHTFVDELADLCNGGFLCWEIDGFALYIDRPGPRNCGLVLSNLAA